MAKRTFAKHKGHRRTSDTDLFRAIRRSFRTLRRLSWELPKSGHFAGGLFESQKTKRDRAFERPIPRGTSRHYFSVFTLFPRAADPYRLPKHFRQRRSRRLMKLGARSSLPQ